jgi:hypothetical protein
MDVKKDTYFVKHVIYYECLARHVLEKKTFAIPICESSQVGGDRILNSAALSFNGAMLKISSTAYTNVLWLTV